MTLAIETRYGALAEQTCCLSCGTAVGYITATPGQVCVDLGSGRGTDVMRLAEQVGPTGHAYGIDITEGMLEKARKTANKLGITNASFLHSDLESLALPDASTDWVTSNCVLNHAQDKARVWKEIARILRPGGRFVVSDIYAVEPIGEQYKHDPEAVAECWAGAILKDEYLTIIRGAGFPEVEILEESQPYAKGKALVASFTIAGNRPGASNTAAPAAKCGCRQ
jgi:ubiquinone/menaquinone biosynthesis C-methylase UbiE